MDLLASLIGAACLGGATMLTGILFAFGFESFSIIAGFGAGTLFAAGFASLQGGLS